MSHEITIRSDGVAEAMFAKRPAWHGLGMVFDHAPTSDEILAENLLNWEVEQVPVGIPLGDDRYLPSTTHVINRRIDTGDTLGIVGTNYKVLQNTEAFKFLDELFQDDVLRYESAFSLSGGKRVLILARIPHRFTVMPGDWIDPYLCFANHHDGTGAIKVGMTSVRVVCANTYRLAEGDLVNIRHNTGDLKQSMTSAQIAIDKALDIADGYIEKCRTMQQTPLALTDWYEYMDIVCPIPDRRDASYSTRRYNAIIKTRQEIHASYLHEATNNLPGMSRTVWAAWNAITQHVDHLPRKGGDRRMKLEARYNVTQHGTGHNLKKLAYLTACNFAGVEA